MNAPRIAALASLALLAGCSKSEPSSGTSITPTQAPAVTPAARDAFKARCAPCHGQNGSGHGDAPAAAALNPKPPNFNDVAWQKSATDEEIRKAIVYGGAAVSKSLAMPASRDLEGKPDLEGLLAGPRQVAHPLPALDETPGCLAGERSSRLLGEVGREPPPSRTRPPPGGSSNTSASLPRQLWRARGA